MPVARTSLSSRGLAWWASAVLLIAVAVAVTAAAGTRPSFDAYGWLVWGHMTLQGGLDTNAAPSWKPLPYLFTVPFGLLGDAAALRLWMVTATAVSLAGLVFAGRLAYRLASAGVGVGVGGAGGVGVGATGAADAGAGRGRRRWAGWTAALLAAVALLALHDEFPYGYLHYVLSAQTDPMIVTFVLAAADCLLCGRPRWVFALLVLAALGRPEVWPLLLLDAAWLWRARPGMRWAVAGALAAAALLWFGIPALSSRSWLVAADNADASGFGPTGDRATGVLSRFVVQTPWPLSASAIGAVAVAVWHRDRVVLMFAAGVVVWIAAEVAFGLQGWPALGRYMFEPSAVVVVLGAGFVGRLLAGTALPGALGAMIAVAVAAGTIPFLVNQGRDARADLVAQQARTAQFDALGTVIDRLGGAARIRGCGEAISEGLETQTVLAYDIGENVDRIGYKLPQAGHPRNPIVVFSSLDGGGWRVRSYRQRAPGCRRLHAG
jgi:hypothetical protein